ncbi:MAG: hypothetical protein ACJ8HJ_10640 [Massilia sp.]|jgi:hypothetical protein
MRHTLKAVFEQPGDAQHALDALLASGYPRADIALSNMPAPGPDTSLRHTAARLLGALYHRHAQPGDTRERHIVTLTTGTDPEAARATGIMAQYRPAGLEDIHDEGDPASWTGTVAPRHDYPPGAAPGALQHRPHEDSHYFGTQNADAPPAGNTFKETMGSIAQWGAPDEDVAWVAPAGRSELRSDANPLDQTWEDVEPALKSDWEYRHAGSEASAWDKVKLAMRHGWERMHH